MDCATDFYLLNGSPDLFFRMFAIGFDFHSVEADDPVYVKSVYVAGGLVSRIDWYNAPHPVAFHVAAESSKQKYHTYQCSRTSMG